MSNHVDEFDWPMMTPRFWFWTICDMLFCFLYFWGGPRGDPHESYKVLGTKQTDDIGWLCAIQRDIKDIKSWLHCNNTCIYIYIYVYIMIIISWENIWVLLSFPWRESLKRGTSFLPLWSKMAGKCRINGQVNAKTTSFFFQHSGSSSANHVWLQVYSIIVYFLSIFKSHRIPWYSIKVPLNPIETL